jgi:hypothetical protein
MKAYGSARIQFRMRFWWLAAVMLAIAGGLVTSRYAFGDDAPSASANPPASQPGEPLPSSKSITIEAGFEPKTLAVNTLATLNVELFFPEDLPSSPTIQAYPPPGFVVTLKSGPLGQKAGKKLATFDVQTPKTYIPKGKWSMTVVVFDKDKQLAAERLTFEFEQGISLTCYFILGLAGIACGYLTRLIVDSLNSLPKPPTTAARDADTKKHYLGWLADLIEEHYLFADFLVTVILGFAVLATLVKEDHPPDTGSYWYSALLLGFGMGLLTNSDLITRLRTRS